MREGLKTQYVACVIGKKDGVRRIYLTANLLFGLPPKIKWCSIFTKRLYSANLAQIQELLEMLSVVFHGIELGNQRFLMVLFHDINLGNQRFLMVLFYNINPGNQMLSMVSIRRYPSIVFHVCNT